MEPNEEEKQPAAGMGALYNRTVNQAIALAVENYPYEAVQMKPMEGGPKFTRIYVNEILFAEVELRQYAGNDRPMIYVGKSMEFLLAEEGMLPFEEDEEEAFVESESPTA